MAKLPRKTHTIFAGSAPAAPTGIRQFGSLANPPLNYTLDPVVIQQLAAWAQGFSGAVVGNKNPAMEDLNAVLFEKSYQLAYLFQEGIPEWDAATTYFNGSFVSSAGVIYRSTQDNNTNNLVTNTAFWLPYAFGYSVVSAPAINTDQNNYNPTGFAQSTTFLKIDPTAMLTITGLAAGAAGQTLALMNVGNYQLYLKNQSTASTAANRFLTQDGFDVIIRPNEVVYAIYDTTLSRWLFVNKVVTSVPDPRQRRQFSFLSDNGAASPAIIAEGISGAFSGTGGTITGNETSGQSPDVVLNVDAVAGHGAMYTTPGAVVGVYAAMDLFVHIRTLAASLPSGSNVFVGYVDDPAGLLASLEVNGSALAGRNGWGFWFFNDGLNLQAFFTCNAGGGFPTNDLITGGSYPPAGDILFNVRLDAGTLYFSLIINGAVGGTFSTAAAVPAQTNALTLHPVVAIGNADGTHALQFGFCSMVGDYPA